MTWTLLYNTKNTIISNLERFNPGCFLFPLFQFQQIVPGIHLQIGQLVSSLEYPFRITPPSFIVGGQSGLIAFSISSRTSSSTSRFSSSSRSRAASSVRVTALIWGRCPAAVASASRSRGQLSAKRPWSSAAADHRPPTARRSDHRVQPSY